MNFTISKDFMLDGKPIKLISGALHYFRICPLYWQDRLEKLKNMVSVKSSTPLNE